MHDGAKASIDCEQQRPPTDMSGRIVRNKVGPQHCVSRNQIGSKVIGEALSMRSENFRCIDNNAVFPTLLVNLALEPMTVPVEKEQHRREP